MKIGSLTKKVLCCLFVVIGLLLPGYITANAAESPSLGSGTEISPYIINSASDLKLVNNNLSAHYKLAKNIDLGGEEWSPIGTSNAAFTGTFDGNGYTISNFKISSNVSYAGLFGYVNKALIRDLNLSGVSINAYDYVGGLAGSINASTIENCNITNSSVGGRSYVGGLAGNSTNVSNFTECSSNADVTATSSYAGGLAGYYYNGTIDKSYFTGTVTSTYDYVGGIFGYGYYGTFTKSYSTGTIKGRNYVGSFAGYKYYGNTFENCFALGSATGTSYVAGMVGYCSSSSTFKNCYSAANVSGTSNIGGFYNGSASITSSYYDAEKTSLTNNSSVSMDRLTSAMINKNNYKDWDFDEIWDIDNGSSYPYLKSVKRPDNLEVKSVSLSGSGTRFNPYIITTAEQLKLLHFDLGSYYRLGANIDFYGQEWTPVGTSSVPFTGSLDGNGYTISNFKITNTNNSYLGLIGVASNATIKNLNLSKVVINGKDYVGALVGNTINTTTIKKCNILNGTIKGANYVGGLVGYGSNTLNITECSSNADVTSTANYAGGLTGYYYNGKIDKCYFTGTVNATYDYVGGIFGYGYYGTFTRSYSTGTIKGRNYAGSFAGYKYYGNTFENCFALGNATGTSYVAGMVGYCSSSSTFKNCYSAANVSGTSNIGGFYNGSVSLTNCYYDAEKIGLMNNFSTRIDRLTAGMVSIDNYVDWDFDDIWAIDDGNSYPYLKSIKEPAEVKVDSVAIEGKGTQNNPYIIKTAKQLNLLHYDLNSYYKLGADIDFKGEEWTPVGTSNAPFVGNFDGNGYTISNFKITKATTDYVGFFSIVNNGVVRNLNISGAEVEGKSYTGILVGNSLNTTTIKRCKVLNSTVKGYNYVGGLVGYGSNTLNITECSSNANVISTSNYAGGLVGYYYNGAVDKSYFTGEVTATYDYVGGIFGYGYYGTFTRSYSTGTIKGRNYAGSFAGYKYYGNTFENCFALGSATGTSYVAGMVGYCSSRSTFRNCYSAAKVSGTSNVGGFYTGSVSLICSYYDSQAANVTNTFSVDIDRLTAAMTCADNYEDWDFDDIWDIEDGSSYPYLRNVTRPAEVDITSLNIEGTGTENDPFIIRTAEQLKLVKNSLSAHFKLAANIDLKGEEWIPVGTTNAPFIGVFDGNGYTISNFKISKTSTDYVGFFGAVSNTVIKNVNISGAEIEGKSYTGALVGNTLNTTTIKRCKVLNSTVKGYNYVGGLVGYGSNTLNITECSSNAVITSTSNYAGGLAGYYYNGTVDKSYFTGEVTATYDYVGGICGYGYYGTFTRLYSTGTVKGRNYVANLVGYKYYGNTFENCFTLGNVTGSNYVAGMLGYCSSKNTVKNCYSAAKVSGTSNVSGLYNGSVSLVNSYYDAEASGINNSTTNNIDRLTGAMVSRENFSGWDFKDVWAMDDGASYPYLKDLPVPSSVAAASSLIEGNGTETNPYIIKTKEQLKLIKYHLSAWYILANDINLDGEEWVPIGNTNAPFTGHLDGKNFKVYNFVINSEKDYQGFFAATNDAVICNFNLSKLKITGYNYVGSLIGNGMGNKSKLINCHITEAEITAHSYVGGIAGSYNGSMSKCSFQGVINASGDYAGGAAGYAPVGGDYSDLTIDVTITGGRYIGGVTGYTGGTLNITGGSITSHNSGKGYIGNYSGNDDKCVVSGTSYSGVIGTGTSSDPYIITGTEGIEFAAQNPDKHFKLGGDINGGGKVVSPIGSSSNPFTGGFDGNGHTISNLVIRNTGGTGGTGLFGHTNGGTIKNIKISNVVVDGGNSDYTGGLVGYNESEEAIIFEDCYITDTTINAKSYVGSLIGGSKGLVIVKNCYSDAAINADGGFVGGLAGSCILEMHQSYFIGVINAKGNYVGGLVGFTPKASFEESFNSADLTGASYVGGLIGGKGSDEVTLLNCYAVGKLTGTSYVAGIIGTSTGTSTVMTNVYAGTQIECTSHSGGLSGDNANITLTSCYYDKVVNSASAETDYARTTDVMIYKPNFVNWNFGDIWSIIEGETYPYLRKMEMPAKVRPSVNSLKARTVNALNGNAVSGLTINIRRGSNAKTGDIVKSITTASDGTININNLAAGDYTLEIMGSGYVTTYVNYTVKNGENNAGDISVMPVVTGNKMTIVLNWGANPTDLDAHLTGSGIDEVYYGHKNSTGAQLDVDDTTSYGPETITIDFDKIPEGTYNYYVKWFSGSGTWASSEARVQVYLDNKLIGEYTPSSSLATSSNWDVLSVDTKTRTVKAK